MNETIRKYPVASMVIAGCALFIAATTTWWLWIYQSPKHVFEGMLTNNLTTTSVTKNELSTSENQNALQRVRLQLGGTNAAKWFVTLQQSAGTVSTESIGTKDAGYVRYTEIIDAKKNKADTYKKVLGIWGKSAKGDSSSLNQLLEQSLLDITSAPVPPIGNVQPKLRANMLQYIRTEDVFVPDYKTVKTGVVNGREVYVYDVSVKLAPYLRLMQSFAQNYGFTSLDQVSPSDYQKAKPANLKISVDKLSHQMLRVEYAENSFSETFTDHDVDGTIQLPAHTIPVTELQKRLQSAVQ